MHRRTPSTRLSFKSQASSIPSPEMLPMPLLHPIGSPKKHRLKHRTALIALFSLLTFSCYLLFVAYPSLDLSRSLLTHVHDHDRPRVHEEPPKHRKTQHHLQPVPPQRPPLSLSPTEELAALSAFIAALPHNVLPPTVNPDLPLDPQLVLDFDPRSDSARDELNRVVEQVWSRFPVILFTKLHSAESREVRFMLTSMNLKPMPLIVEVDQREDGQVLLPLLTRLTHVPALPILLIGGQPVGIDTPDTKGVMTEIRNLHEKGELARRILEAGSTVETGKRKGKGNKRRAT